MAADSGYNTGTELQTPIFNAFSLPTDDYTFSDNPFSLIDDRFSFVDSKVNHLYKSLFGFSDITGQTTEGMIEEVDDWLAGESYQSIPNYTEWEASIDAILTELNTPLIGMPGSAPAQATFVPVVIHDDWTVDDSPPTLTWTGDDLFSSDIYAVLSAKILDGITNGGTGISAAAEDAIWTRGTRRLEAEADAKRQIARNEISAGGFSLPPGALVGRLSELDAEILRNEENLNDTIMIEQAKLAQDYSKFIIDQGLQLENILRDFFNNRINTTIAENEAQVNVFRSILESQVSLITAHAGVDIEQYKANVERFKAEVGHYDSYIRAWVEYIKADVSRRTALTQALIAKIDQHIKAYLAWMELRKSGLEFRINVTAQFIASLLNATNTGATTSYSTGESRTESVGHTSGLSETIG